MLTSGTEQQQQQKHYTKDGHQSTWKLFPILISTLASEPVNQRDHMRPQQQNKNKHSTAQPVLSQLVSKHRLQNEMIAAYPDKYT